MTAHAPAPAERATMDPLDPAKLERERRELERAWSSPPGLWGWLVNTDHKSVGKRYIVTAMVFFLLGGVQAALMRLQLARPENRLIGPDEYNQIFSTHGTTMMFLFAVPILMAIGLYLVPLMVGTRNIAFPRLNLYGYYVYLKDNITAEKEAQLTRAWLDWFGVDAPLAVSETPFWRISRYDQRRIERPVPNQENYSFGRTTAAGGLAERFGVRSGEP